MTSREWIRIQIDAADATARLLAALADYHRIQPGDREVIEAAREAVKATAKISAL